MTGPIKVTVEDLEKGESNTVEVGLHDYVIICTGDARVANYQLYPKVGTVVITIKGAKIKA